MFWMQCTTQLQSRKKRGFVTFLFLHYSLRCCKKWRLFQGIWRRLFIFHFDVAWRSALCHETSGSEKIEVKVFGTVLPWRNYLSEKFKKINSNWPANTKKWRFLFWERKEWRRRREWKKKRQKQAIAGRQSEKFFFFFLDFVGLGPSGTWMVWWDPANAFDSRLRGD